jgi:hypothetical protein
LSRLARAAWLAVASVTVVGAPTLAGASEWGVELQLGSALNARMPLTVEQDGREVASGAAAWETRGFEPPLYYVARAWRREDDGGWMLDLVHHKIHLRDRGGSVQSFSITHGYNLVQLSQVRWSRPWRWAWGAGVVIAHPENTIQGRSLDERGGPLGRGYYLAGPMAGALAGVEWRLGPRWHLGADVRTTAAWVRVPVDGGHADAPNLAAHASVGVGMDFAGPERAAERLSRRR